ncbi:response regulator, partial [Nostoc sp. NIES-2111]
DFAMPGMNGAEVARRIRETRPDLPIILATGFAESAALDSIARPDTPVLRKPFGLDELQLILNEVIATRDRNQNRIS